MSTRDPEHQGKIPWATAERNLGRDAALQLVDKGKVAPPPEQDKHGDAQPFVNDAREYLENLTNIMNEEGTPGHLTVMYRKPKSAAAEVDDSDE